MAEFDVEGLARAFAGNTEEQTNVAEQEEAVEQEKVVEETVVNQEETVQTEDKNIEQPVIDEFPSDKFGGKFKSWEEVNEFINRPQESFKDDFIKKVVETYNSNGNLEPFFKAYSTDWESMGTEEVLKQKFFEENKDFDPKVVEKMWKKEQSKFDPEEMDEDELEIFNAKRQKEAERFKAEKLKEREQYLQPSVQKEDPKEVLERIRQTVNALPEVKSLKENGKITYKIGDSDFSFKVDNTELITESMVDMNNFTDMFLTDGKPDVNKWSDVVAYAQNPDRMRQALVDFGKSLGRQELEAELKNPRVPNTQPDKQTVEYSSFEEGLAKAFAQASK